jgi:hypothetical protein
LDRRTAECWIGEQKNVTKRNKIFDRRTAECWTGDIILDKRIAECRKGGFMLDSRTEYWTGGRQNVGKENVRQED